MSFGPGFLGLAPAAEPCKLERSAARPDPQQPIRARAFHAGVTAPSLDRHGADAVDVAPGRT